AGAAARAAKRRRQWPAPGARARAARPRRAGCWRPCAWITSHGISTAREAGRDREGQDQRSSRCWCASSPAARCSDASEQRQRALEQLVAPRAHALERTLHRDRGQDADVVERRAVVLVDTFPRPVDVESAGKGEGVLVSVHAARRLADDLTQAVVL